ncbi:MAG: hypothetical protein ACYTBJ_00905 [Planctomycetota bacterium]|jgi:hypothetical protein
MGWLAGWSYRKKIRIHGTYIEDDVTVPLPINLSTSAGRTNKDLTAVFTEVGSSSQKIAITKSDGVTQVPVEVSFWDNSNNRAQLFAKVPLSSGADEYLYIYYDSTQPNNTTYVGLPTDTVAQSVWGTAKRIYNLNENRSNLITNGYFGTDETGWSFLSGVTHSIVSGRQNLNRNSQGYENHVWQDFPTEIGKKYEWSVYVHNVSHQMNIWIGNVNLKTMTSTEDLQTHSGSFAATAATTRIAFRAAASVSADITYDNVCVNELFRDSSENQDHALTNAFVDTDYAAGIEVEALGGRGFVPNPVNRELKMQSVWTSGISHTIIAGYREPLSGSGEMVLSADHASQSDGDGRAYMATGTINFQNNKGSQGIGGVNCRKIPDSWNVTGWVFNGINCYGYFNGEKVNTAAVTVGGTDQIEYYNMWGKDFTSAVNHCTAFAFMWCFDGIQSDAFINLVARAFRDEAISYYEDGEDETIVNEWLGDWAYRIPITVDGSKVTSALTDYPLMIKLSNTCGIDSRDLTPFFDELGAVSGDSFAGTDGISPSPHLWTINDGTPTIQSNKLELNETGGQDTILQSNFRLNGDFNARLEFDVNTGPATNTWWLALKMVDPVTGYWAFVSRAYFNGAHKYLARYNQGVTTTGGSSSTSDTSCHVRIRRNTTTILAEWYDGGSWNTIMTQGGFTSTEMDLYVEVQSFTGNPAYDIDLTNFTIAAGTVAWRLNTHPNRKRVAITDSDGLTQLPVENIYFGHESEYAVYYTKVPLLQAGVNKKLYVYYDSSKPSNPMVGDIGDPIAQTVWDDNFKGVWHICQNPENDIVDSTTNALTFAGSGTWARSNLSLYSDLICTVFDNDRAMNAVGDGFDPGTGNFTIEGLARTGYDHTAQQRRIYSEYGANTNDLLSLGVYTDNKLYSLCRDTEADDLTIQGFGSAVNNDAWFHLAARRISQTVLEGYVNGTFAGSDTDASIDDINLTGGEEATIGCWNSGGTNSGGWNGEIAEVRISNVSRSAAWLLATNYGVKDNIWYGGTQESLAAKTFAWLMDAGVPWKYRKKITIDHSIVDSNLTDFPVQVTIAGTDHFFEAGDYPNDVSDDFTGSNGDVFNKALWRWSDANEEDDWRIQSNKLYVDISGNVDSTILANYKMAGDFDIQLDFDSLSITDSGGGNESIRLFVTDADTGAVNAGYISANYNSGNKFAWNFKVGGAWVGIAEASRSNNNGKFRVVRAGSVLHTYYRDGSSEVWTFGGSDTIGTDDLMVKILADSGTGGSISANVDNYVVNAGSVVWDYQEYGFGKKVAFTLDDHSTQLYAELDYINMTDKEAIYHVKVPSVSSVLDTEIYMYYDPNKDDNTTYIGDVYDRGCENVWDSSYKGVFHFKQVPITAGGSCLLDSSSNAVHGAATGMSISDVVDPPSGARNISRGWQFSSDSKHVIISGASGDGWRIADYGTMECFFELNGYPSGGRNSHLIAKDGSYILKAAQDADSDQPRWQTYSSAAYYTVGSTGGTLPLNTEQSVVGTIGSDDDMYLWVNGKKTYGPTAIPTQVTQNENDVYLGSFDGGASQYADATIFGIRYSLLERSDAWIKASHHNFYNELSNLSAPETWLPDYDKRIRVDISGSAVTTALSDFPITVAFTQPAIMTELAWSSGTLTEATAGTAGLTLTETNNTWWALPGAYTNIIYTANGGSIQIPCSVSNSRSIRSRFFFEGDFDVEIGYRITSAPSVNFWDVCLAVYDEDGTDNFRVLRSYRNTEGGHSYVAFKYTGSYGTLSSDATSDTEGKFRIVRSGSTFSGYYWNGASWTLLRSDTITMGLVRVGCFCQTSSSAVTGIFSNLRIASAATLGDFSQMHPMRKKMALTDYQGNILDSELNWFDPVNSIVSMHARVPDWQPYENKIFYLYYDKDAADNGAMADTGSLQASQVWKNGYMGVYHCVYPVFNALFAATNSMVRDSSHHASANNGTPWGSNFLQNDLINTGKFGGAYDMDGGNEAINIGNFDPELATFEAHIGAVTAATLHGLINKDQHPEAQRSWQWRIDTDGKIRLISFDNDTTTVQPVSAGSIDSAGNHYIWARHGHTVADVGIGATAGTALSTGFSLQTGQTNDIFIGKSETDNEMNFHGTMNEIRISNVVRPDAWMSQTAKILRGNGITFTAEATAVVEVMGRIVKTGSFKTVSAAWVAFSESFLSVSQIKICSGGTWKTLV